MRSFHVRRKDLDHVPFQYYVGADGTARLLEEGYTGVFTIQPPKGDIDTVYIRITQDLIKEFAERWDISQGALMRVAAKGAEAWLKGGVIPQDHYYGPESIRMDQDWYLREADGSPAMAVDPYSFEVITDDPWPSILDWDFSRPRDESPTQAQSMSNRPAIIFGFTLDVFPAMAIVGYEQMKHKIAEASIAVEVRMQALNELPADVSILVVPSELETAAHQAAPNARVYALAEMVGDPIYDMLVNEFKKEQSLKVSMETP